RRRGAGGREQRHGGLALPAAAQPRQHDRGRDLRDPAQHHRRACARPPEEPLVDFSFSNDQEELRRHARSYLAERFPAERVAELADSDEGWDPASWRELAELGWLGVSVPEEHGGAGLGFVDEALLLEELGRALYPGPYFSTVGLALPALGPEELAQVVSGEVRWSASLDGSLVPDLGIVDRVVVAENGEARAVPARGEVLETTDSTRRLGRLDAADGTPLAGDVSLLRPRALIALAAEAVGIGERALEYC